MDAVDRWDPIRRAVDDTRSGSLAITLRAAQGVRLLRTRREVLKAGRALLRAHPAMGSLWRLVIEAHEADDVAQAVDRFAGGLARASETAADQIRWVAGRRRQVVVTCSASSTVEAALERIASRVAGVRCTVSLPGGEGRRFAKRLADAGFEAEAVPDAAVAGACQDADLALVGADAVTDDGVVNKVGTYPLALAAADAGIGCYALAPTHKLVPAALIAEDDAFETTPLRLFDAVLTERGPRRAAAITRAITRIDVPLAVRRIAP
jgi:translation initiation factor eIF-2B subunit delta